MNKISVVTRRDIANALAVERIYYYGRLPELDFLSRLYNLNELPSFDRRYKNAFADIHQHRINNNDWDDNWIFTDERINLYQCDDKDFLKFICEMIHPIVRNNQDEVVKLLQLFNSYLENDNFELIEEKRISNRPVYIGRNKFLGNSSIQKSKNEIINFLSEEYIIKQTSLMENSIEKSPELAIGTAKELVETICQTILEERSIPVDKNWDLIHLLKNTSKQINLTPEGIPDEVKASKTIKSILGSLTTVVQGISELRNQYGSGHGKKATFKGLTSRHAKLAVGAATTLVIFLYETHKVKANKS